MPCAGVSKAGRGHAVTDGHGDPYAANLFGWQFRGRCRQGRRGRRRGGGQAVKQAHHRADNRRCHANHGHREGQRHGVGRARAVLESVHDIQGTRRLSRQKVAVDRCTDRASQRPVLGRTVIDVDNRVEVREFLTSRRAKITPQQAGLSEVGQRRVPGLRRSEVAALAQMSVEYGVAGAPTTSAPARAAPYTSTTTSSAISPSPTKVWISDPNPGSA
jgi:hypothetical protein